jgi:SAM-dependent methyltransferase
MNTRELFSDKANIYAASRPRYPAALYEWLVGHCVEHTAVWDAGCGNGQAAADLKNYFNQVEATDVSAAQIANAPRMDRVRFSVQPAEATTFANNSFDAVCVAQALHWFNFDKFWPEVKRVLRPGGVFAAWGYSWPHLNPALDAVLQESLLPIIEPFWAAQNKLLWHGYRDVPLPFAPLACPQFNLTMHWDLEQYVTFLHSWSAVRRCIDAHGDAFFVEARRKMASLWGSAAQRTVTMDFVLISGRHAG